MAASTEYCKMRSAISDILEHVGGLLSDMTCAAPASSEPGAQGMIDASISRYWTAYHALKQRQDEDTLSVAVLALTKSGKSTLLNALVGADLLPMNNVPETARICRVIHTAGVQPYLVEGAAQRAANNNAGDGNVTARGDAAVRARLQELNHAVRERTDSGSLLSPSVSIRRTSLSPQLASSPPSSGHLLQASTSLTAAGSSTLELLNAATAALPTAAAGDALAGSPPSTPAAAVPPSPPGAAANQVLSIHAPITALMEYEQQPAARKGAAVTDAEAAKASSMLKLHLLDTPGPNEAGEEGLRFQVERLLDSVDVALYLLDYTKLKTQDEAGMFGRIKQVNPSLVKRLSQRMFFVVNKFDAAQTNDGQDEDATREYVAQLVTRQMGLEGFALDPRQVLLLSARNALLSRLVLAGRATPDTRARFVQLAFGRFASPNMITQDQMSAAANALLADSGIMDLEAQVLAYLYNHSGAVKQLALVDDLGRLLADVRNVAASCTAALTASADALAARINDAGAELQATLEAFNAAQGQADAVANEVSEEIRAHLHTLRGRLFSAIINALDTSSSGPQQAEPAAGAGAAAGPAARRWRGVRERFLSIFTTTLSNFPGGASNVSFMSSSNGGRGLSSNSSSAVLSAASAAVARSRSKAELAALLAALHEDLTAQIHAEVREFWGVMEAVAAARHAELLASLNEHLGKLSTQVESVVSRSLHVELTPVTLSLAMPDASQFHADLEQLLAKGVIETRERHIRVNQKEVTEQVLRRGNGICRWGDYWESVPRMRTVVEAYTCSVYELAPGEITAHFIGMVDSAIDATQASLSSYVATFVNQQLQDAKQQLQQYSDAYLSVMTGALDAGHKGKEFRLAALTQVQSFLDRVSTISEQYTALQGALERGMPRAQDATLAFDELEDLCEDEEEEEVGQEEGQEHEQGEEYGAAQPVAAGSGGSELLLPELLDDLLLDTSATAAAVLPATPFAQQQQQQQAAAAAVLTATPVVALFPAAVVEPAAAEHEEPVSPDSISSSVADAYLATPLAAAAAVVPPAANSSSSMVPADADEEKAQQAASVHEEGGVVVAAQADDVQQQQQQQQQDEDVLLSQLNDDPVLQALLQTMPAAAPADNAPPPPAGNAQRTVDQASSSTTTTNSASLPAARSSMAPHRSGSNIMDSGRFDYAAGFYSAMSTSMVDAEAQEATAAAAATGADGDEQHHTLGSEASDEWDLVEEHTL